MRVDGEEAVIPGKYAGGLEDNCPVKAFAGRDLARHDRIFNHLASGGIAVISGPVTALNELAVYVQRRSTDLKPRSESIIGRLMVLAKNDICEGIEPPVHIPHLSKFCGEASLTRDKMFLIPLVKLRKLQDALAQKWQVETLSSWIMAGDDVIPPKSQETVGLFREAIAAQTSSLPNNAQVLDMGCGSGVLTLLAAVLLDSLKPRITATDVMPEATASTRLNATRFADEGLIAPDSVELLKAGDLFAPVGNASFDLIIFNAPWVVAPVGSRADISLNDPKQKTIARFLEEIPRHLEREGRLVLGYADNSGQKAVARVLELAEKAGLRVIKERSVRVQTHRKKRKWQRIYVWEMERKIA
ncbi:methyltransferase [bacterium]|nr:methyltransferase [bacterium]